MNRTTRRNQPQNLPRSGNPVLSDKQLERVIRAAIVGYGGDLTPARAEAIVRWAERTMIDAAMLGRIVSEGEATVRKHAGKIEFRQTTPEERDYILDGDGKQVERT